MWRAVLLMVVLGMVGCSKAPAFTGDAAAVAAAGKPSSHPSADARRGPLPVAAASPDASGDCAVSIAAAGAPGCGDEDLVLLDQRLARAYRRALAQSAQPEAERSTQGRWLQGRRAACAHDSDCLRRVYLQQLKYFEGAPRYAHSARAE